MRFVVRYMWEVDLFNSDSTKLYKSTKLYDYIMYIYIYIYIYMNLAYTTLYHSLLYTVLYRDIFSYHWISMGTQILSWNFSRTGLQDFRPTGKVHFLDQAGKCVLSQSKYSIF